MQQAAQVLVDGSTTRDRDRRTSIDGDPDPLGDAKDILEREFEEALLEFWRGQLERLEEALEARAPAKFKAVSTPLRSGIKKAVNWDELPKWIQDALGERFWAGEDEKLVSLTAKFLERGADAALDHHATLVEGLPGASGVDWTGINTEVAEWAREYAGELCRATRYNPKTGRYEFTRDQRTINANTRRAIGVRVATWFETPGATLGDLMGEISQLRAFGPQAPDVPGKQTRAQLVATTEITRSAANGNRIGADRLAEQLGPLGVVAQDTWHTNADDKVCWQVCRPLHGKKVPHGEPFGINPVTSMPIRIPVDHTHPGCYCWVTTRYEVAE